MPRKPIHTVKLTTEHRQQLTDFVAAGTKSAREITRARILLFADEGKSNTEIVALLGISRPTVATMREKYATRATEQVLELLPDAPRSGRPIEIDTTVEANITMLACSEPPAGRARWTLRLIADKLVSLAVCDSISHESVRGALKKTS